MLNGKNQEHDRRLRDGSDQEKDDVQRQVVLFSSILDYTNDDRKDHSRDQIESNRPGAQDDKSKQPSGADPGKTIPCKLPHWAVLNYRDQAKRTKQDDLQKINPGKRPDTRSHGNLGICEQNDDGQTI